MNHIPPTSLYDEFIARIDRLSTPEQIRLINELQSRVNRAQIHQADSPSQRRTERDMAEFRRKRAKDYMIQSYK